MTKPFQLMNVYRLGWYEPGYYSLRSLMDETLVSSCILLLYFRFQLLD